MPKLSFLASYTEILVALRRKTKHLNIVAEVIISLLFLRPLLWCCSVTSSADRLLAAATVLNPHGGKALKLELQALLLCVFLSMMKIKLLADVWSITDAMQLHCWQWQKYQQLLEQLGQGEHKQPGGNII